MSSVFEKVAVISAVIFSLVEAAYTDSVHALVEQMQKLPEIFPERFSQQLSKFPPEGLTDRAAAWRERLSQTDISDTLQRIRTQLGSPELRLDGVQKRWTSAQAAAQSSLQQHVLPWLEQVGDRAQSLLPPALPGWKTLQAWGATHENLLWAMHHPLISGAIAIVTFIAFIYLLKLLISPKIWFSLLTAPIKVMARWASPKRSLSPTEQQKQVNLILARMQEIQSEQQALQRQLNELIGSKPR